MKIKSSVASGFSLVEVTIALGVAVFCLVSVFGLLPIGITSNQSSIQQTAAANIARAIGSDLRAADSSTPMAATSSVYNIPIPSPGSGPVTHTLYLREDGTTGVSPSAVDSQAVPALDPRYCATVTFTPPSASPSGQRTATMVRIFITWPALGGGNYTGSYETVTALDRN